MEGERRRAWCMVCCSGLAAASLCFSGCGDASEPESPGGEGASKADGTGTTETSVSSGGTALAQSAPSLPPALLRLQAMIEDAPGYGKLARADRLERARDWMLENYPDMPARQQAGMAQILAMIDQMLAGEEVTMNSVRASMESQVLMHWLMDADGDGILSDEEIRAITENPMMWNEMMGEYFADRFDTDGDGGLGPEEQMAMGQEMMRASMEQSEVLADFATARLWDTDLDGRLSEAELAAGREAIANAANPWADIADRARESAAEQEAEVQALEAESEIAEIERITEQYGEGATFQETETVNDDGSITIERITLDPEGNIVEHSEWATMQGSDGSTGTNDADEVAAAWEGFTDEMGDQLQLTMYLMEQGVYDLFSVISVSDQAEMSADMVEQMQPDVSTMPQHSDFDADGDGQVTGEEQEAYGEAIQAWQQDLQAQNEANMEAMMVQMMQAQFEAASQALDTDGDGLVIGNEWEAGLAALQAQQDQALFQWNFDTDGSGSVTEVEVVQFMDWYESGSPRGDVNMDGSIDVADLQMFNELYLAQQTANSDPAGSGGNGG